MPHACRSSSVYVELLVDRRCAAGWDTDIPQPIECTATPARQCAIELDPATMLLSRRIVVGRHILPSVLKYPQINVLSLRKCPFCASAVVTGATNVASRPKAAHPTIAQAKEQPRELYELSNEVIDWSLRFPLRGKGIVDGVQHRYDGP